MTKMSKSPYLYTTFALAFLIGNIILRIMFPAPTLKAFFRDSIADVLVKIQWEENIRGPQEIAWGDPEEE